MSHSPEVSEAFAVLNPGGRDKTQFFSNGAGIPTDPGHPPVNYHAYAACMRGGFYRSAAEIPKSVKTVLVLLRQRGLEDARKAIRELTKRGVDSLISWKESGLHQVAQALGDAKRAELFRAVCGEAAGFVSSTPELAALYRTQSCTKGDFIPTPYPIEEEAWNFSRPLENRNGILIGTREIDTPSRNHLLAVSIAAGLGESVTVINPDGKSAEKILCAIAPSIRIVNGPLPYPEYLSLMSEHRVVFQLDSSAVPGQVAGDALLCRMPCVGGNGAVDRIAFPPVCAEEASDMLYSLLRDDAEWESAVAASREKALEKLSFSAVSSRLEDLRR
jgi:hypothetical protein